MTRLAYRILSIVGDLSVLIRRGPSAYARRLARKWLHKQLARQTRRRESWIKP